MRTLEEYLNKKCKNCLYGWWPTNSKSDSISKLVCIYPEKNPFNEVINNAKVVDSLIVAKCQLGIYYISFWEDSTIANL